VTARSTHIHKSLPKSLQNSLFALPRSKWRAGGAMGGPKEAPAQPWSSPYDGFLLTNAHVVGGNTSGTATFADGTTTPFRVIGVDSLSDLAVIRADGSTPHPAKLGNASDLRVGQLVVAVGNRGGSRAVSLPAW
jgi:hypothetical protein